MGKIKKLEEISPYLNLPCINLISLNFLFLCRFEAIGLFLLFCLNLRKKVLLCYTISYDKAIFFFYFYFSDTNPINATLLNKCSL